MTSYKVALYRTKLQSLKRRIKSFFFGALRKLGKVRNKDTVDIQPLVYSFRVPSNPIPGSVLNAVLPPYWLYHDHAFGVIWMLFHQDKQFIGIAQLHWCLRFLLDLKNTESEYTGDVNVCIQAVQDDLMEQYANLGTALKLQVQPQRNSNGENSPHGDKDPGNENVPGSSRHCAKEYPEYQKEDSGENVQAETSSSPLRSQKSKSSKLNMCSTIADSGYISDLSLTYNQMISRGPSPYTEQTPLEQIYRASTIKANTTPSMPDIAAMLTSDTSPPDIPLGEMGTEELMSFLNSSRTEYVERIKKEVERLHDLEKFMEGVDKHAFKAYVTDDLARRIDKLDGQSVIKELKTML